MSGDRPPRAARPAGSARWLRWTLGAAVVVTVLLPASCGLAGFVYWRPKVDLANEWIALLDEGRFDEAFDELCGLTYHEGRRAAEVALLRERFGAGIDDYDLSDLRVVGDEGPGHIVRGEIETPAATWEVRLDLEKVDGEWQVCEWRAREVS